MDAIGALYAHAPSGVKKFPQRRRTNGRELLAITPNRRSFQTQPASSVSFFLFGAFSMWLALFHAASRPGSLRNVLRTTAFNSRMMSRSRLSAAAMLAVAAAFSASALAWLLSPASTASIRACMSVRKLAGNPRFVNSVGIAVASCMNARA